VDPKRLQTISKDYSLPMTEEDDREIHRILEMSDEEVNEEIRKAGGDPKEIARQGRETVKMAIAEADAYREGRLQDTRGEWDDKTVH